MKKTFFTIMSVAAICAALFSSCQKDPVAGGDNNGDGNGDTPEPEPEEVTVSLKLASGSSSAFDLKHGEDGVTGEVSFDFVAELSAVSENDVTVSFEVSCDAVSTSKIDMSKTSVTIPAGKTISDAVTVSASDWSELESNVDARTFTISVTISSFEGADKKGSGAYVTVTKAAFAIAPKIHIGTDSELGGCTANSNVTEWSFEFWATNGATVENPDANTFNGLSSSDVAVDNDLLNFIVDFKTAKAIGGIYIQHWGPDYRAESFKLSYSNDKSSWTDLGELEVDNSVYYVVFDADVNAQYLKYEMTAATPRVDLTYFRLYEK